MTTFVYLTLDQIIQINADQSGAGVRDLEGLEAQVFRPQSGSSFVGDFFPTIWSKAAAYLHGLSSSQSFHDGNKRTAWFAAVTFLNINGHKFPSVPDIEAETFVQAIAQQVFNTDEEPDKTLEKAAEWFENKWVNQRMGPAIHPRLEYMYLAQEVSLNSTSTVNVKHGGTDGLILKGKSADDVFPTRCLFFVVGSLWWHYSDPDPQTLTVRVVPDLGAKRINRAINRIQLDRGLPITHPTIRAGYSPRMFVIPMNPVFLEPTTCSIHLELDGELIAESRFQIQLSPEVPDTPELLG